MTLAHCKKSGEFGVIWFLFKSELSVTWSSGVVKKITPVD